MALNRRIIFTVTNDLTYDQRMQKICRSLAGAGYEVELVGRQRSNSVPLDTEPFKQTRLSCVFDKGKIFYLEYNLRLFFYLLLRKTHALCAVDLDTITAVYMAGRLKRIERPDRSVLIRPPRIITERPRLIYDAHEYFTEVPEVIGRPKIKRAWEWVEKTFVPKFDLAYTVSPAIAELFSQKYGTPFHVIMNVPILQIPNAKFQIPKPAPSGWPYSNQPVILYQGALNEGRGLEHLIGTIRQIDAKLLLAGEGDLSDELRALVKKLALQDKVQFLGHLAPDKLKEITATVGINLLENKGLSYYYSLSNKFFDYINAGVPQVCIDFPEYRKINEEFEVAVLVKDCSENEIKNAIGRLISDKELYSRLQKNCEVCSTKLNWQNEERKLLALYNELLR